MRTAASASKGAAASSLLKLIFLNAGANSEIRSPASRSRRTNPAGVMAMSVGIGGETLDNSDATAFNNVSIYSVLYSINCTSAAIDYNSIGEEWLRNQNGGAVANIGSTRFDFPGTGTYYQNAFYDALFHQEAPTLGESFALSKIPFIASSITSGV